MIKRWNSTVRHDDLVIHLGDFALYGQSDKVARLCAELNGHKILVRGNHDRKSIHWYLTHGFDFVCDHFSIGQILFTHRPVPKQEFLLMPYRLNIHGHIHEKQEFDKDIYKNMSVEQTNYMPVNLDKILTQYNIKLKRKLKQGD
jgi:calcineurin-like phosphoesterase family protein